MVKHFIRNVNFFPEGESRSAVWSQTRFGMIFLLQGQGSEDWRGSRTEPPCPSPLPTAEGLWSGDRHPSPDSLQIEGGWQGQCLICGACPSTLHLKGQSRHAKGQSGFQPFPLSFYIKLLGTSESRSSGATFCFSCLLVSHLIVIRQLCNGTAVLQEMPKRRPWALSSRISLHPC